MSVSEPEHGMQFPLENYYATVIDSVGDGVIVIGSDGVITLCNPAAEEITGFSRKHMLDALFQKVFSQEMPLIEIVAKTIRTGITISDHENVVVRNNGRITPVAVTCYPLMRANGDNIGAILTLKDITYIRELEATVRQADRFATMGTLAAGLAMRSKIPWVASKAPRNCWNGNWMRDAACLSTPGS